VNVFEAVGEDNEISDAMEIYSQYVKPEDFVNLGTGIVDFETTYQKIKELGTVRYAIVENEGTQGDKFESLASDLNVMEEHVQGHIKA
jgi:sugar phosphate isomerase/epimerase